MDRPKKRAKMKTMLMTAVAAAVWSGAAWAEQQGWRIHQHTDKMTNEVSKQAVQTHWSHSPYGTKAITLVLDCANPPPVVIAEGAEVGLTEFRVRFDEGTVKQVQGVEIYRTGSGSIVKIADPSFLDGILAGQRLRLGVTFSRGGEEVADFDLTGSRAAYDETC